MATMSCQVEAGLAEHAGDFERLTDRPFDRGRDAIS